MQVNGGDPLITQALYGSLGVPSFPAAAVAANGVSLAALTRYVSDRQAFKVTATSLITASSSLITGSSPLTLFTVTSDIFARVFAVVGTALTSTANTGTLSVGTLGAVTSLLGTTTVDGTILHTANSVWSGATSGAGGGTTTSAVFSNTPLSWALIGGSSNITCTIATNSMTAGTITFYCQWSALTSTSNVVAAL